MKRLLVIGGGLAGLHAAYQAQRAGAMVRVLEAADQAGGVVNSIQENSFLCETGPNTLLNRDAALQKLIAELGLNGEIVEAAPKARERFIVRGGKLVAVPTSVGRFLTTPMLTVGAKLRLLREPWAKARNTNASGDESLADFARRRLGEEVFTYALEPFVAGIFAGNPEKLSVRHAFPRLQKMEDEHGSVLKAGWNAMRNRPKNSQPRLISFREGLGALPGALAKNLGGSLTLRARLMALEKESSGLWEATWETPTNQVREKFDGVTLAVPAYALGRLPLPAALATQLAPLAEIEYAPVSVLLLGYPRAAVGHTLDGFGVLVPAVEKLSILGVLFNSTLFAHRAPAGQVLLTVFVGGARQPELAGLPDAQLAAKAIPDLEKLLRVSGTPIFQKIVRWPRGIPQYNLDHGDKLAVIERTENAWPGLTLAGSYYGGVSVPQCLATGGAAGLRALKLSPTAGA
jgi:oxygen-dependent protoporphyrinogen oxidase